jgi:superfamily II DNA helicase RecQ
MPNIKKTRTKYRRQPNLQQARTPTPHPSTTSIDNLNTSIDNRETARSIYNNCTLSENERSLQLSSAIREMVGFPPRAAQLAALKKLTVDQEDLILVAPTGWGKSLIFQAYIPLVGGGIALLIMPLTALQEDQVRWSTCGLRWKCRRCLSFPLLINQSLGQEYRKDSWL